MATEIVMPRLSDSMEEGTILQWFVAEGDAVREGQPLVEVETDKASVTYEAERGGTVLSLAAATGESVAVGAPIAVVGEPGETAAASAPTAALAVQSTPAPAVSASSATPAPAPAGATPSVGARVKASLLARRLAAELGVDLSALAGSGPHGRVTRADVERGAAAAPGNGSGAPASAKGERTAVALSRIQQTIARRMAESRATIPDFELRCQVDMGAAVALREQWRAIADPPPSFNDLVVKSAALALREFPRVNGAYRDAELELHSRINVGIAVAAQDALLVPTIFDADRRSLIEIAAASRDLAARVRDRTITPAELSGATFSVSNLGMYGIDSFSAVINPPQAAILAVGSLRQRPIVDESDPAHPIVARPTVQLTLACDHRILYGADGARFLVRVRELLENPLALVLGPGA
ncbi:MAG: dihydrolipoamide acetyltransferase family protein [Solirubrobacteraceae bacterium]